MQRSFPLILQKSQFLLFSLNLFVKSHIKNVMFHKSNKKKYLVCLAVLRKKKKSEILKFFLKNLGRWNGCSILNLNDPIWNLQISLFSAWNFKCNSRLVIIHKILFFYKDSNTLLKTMLETQHIKILKKSTRYDFKTSFKHNKTKLSYSD